MWIYMLRVVIFVTHYLVLMLKMPLRKVFIKNVDQGLLVRIMTSEIII